MSLMNLSDNEFEQLFSQALVKAEEFNHLAHLRLGWVHITRYGIDTAIQNVCEQLKAFVSAHGAENKYHHTLTISSLHIISHFIEKYPSLGFSEIIEKEPRLLKDFRKLLETHYSPKHYQSEQARKTYLPPDRVAF